LNYYNKDGYSFINLGDSEELWKFKAADILPQNEKTFAAEAAFFPMQQKPLFFLAGILKHLATTT